MDFTQQDVQVTAHRHFSTNCFNETWTYLEADKPDLAEMLACAYASLYHWQKREDVTPDHLLTAHWLLARVCEKARLPDATRLHADKALWLSENNEVKGFGTLGAYEVQARAAYLEGNQGDGQGFKEKATRYLAELKSSISEEEYGYCKEDIDGIVEYS